MYNEIMNIANIPAGKYVLAVSGGVDSIVLLDILAKSKRHELIVAHFDHGIRPESAEDARFVSALAASYGLRFVQKRAELGAEASEETARKARYAFLYAVKEQHGARAIITAHHQDDVIETVVINLQRGTGWRGLCSLRDLPELRRPLLDIPKAQLVAYAKRHALRWCDDATNLDERYQRNRVRHQIAAFLTENQRRELLCLVARQTEIVNEVECLLTDMMPPVTDGAFSLRRAWCVILPNKVAAELFRCMATVLTGKALERSMLARMVWFAKTARRHKVLQASGDLALETSSATLVVRRR